MKRKLVSLMLVAAMAVSMVAGCGDSSSDSDNSNNSGKTEETGGDKTASADGRVYLLNFKPETDQAWQDLAETYTDQTGVEVNVLTAADGQYSTTMQSEMAKDEAPTIFNIGNSTAAQTWNDYTLDLSDTALYEHVTDKSLSINYDGKVAAVANCYECYGIIYNKKILNDYVTMDGAVVASIDEINSFDTLKAVAEDINSRVDEINEEFGYELTGAFASSGLDSGSSWRFSGHLANMPLYYEFKDDGCDLITGEATIDGTYLENYKNVWDLYVNTSSADPKTLNSGALDARSEFGMEEAVFYQNGTWEYNNIADIGDENLGILPIYIGVDGEENQGVCTGTENYWCVNSKASEDDIQATLDFMNWCVTSDEGVEAMCRDMGFVIPFSSNLESENTLVNEANKYMEEGKTPVTWVFSTMPSEEWKNGVGSALTAYAADQTDANWDKVVSAFVDGWAAEAAAAK